MLLYPAIMRNPDDLFTALVTSSFRQRFRLRGRELRYLQTRGIEVVLGHAAAFIGERLAPAHPRNDGKQTPYRNHPAFVAQHATATCCRGCLEKWHRIARGAPLTAAEQAHILAVLRRWLEAELEKVNA